MLQPKFNRYPKPTDLNSLYFLVQQAFEDGFRGTTFKEVVNYIVDYLPERLAQLQIYDVGPSDSPVASDDVSRTYQPTESGIYTNFLDGNGDPLEVDLTNGFVTITGNTAAGFKVIVSPIDLSGYAQFKDMPNMYIPKYFDYGKMVEVNGVISANTATVITGEPIRINPDEDLHVFRGTNSGQGVVFFDANLDFISTTTIGNVPYAKVTPPPTAVYVMANVSLNLATRQSDVATYAIKQSGYVAPTPPRIENRVAGNLFNALNSYDGHYYYNGNTDIGVAVNKVDYSFGWLILDPLETQLTYLRRTPAPATLGGFFTSNMEYITGSNVAPGVNSGSGTIEIPSGAHVFLFNVSNNPAQRDRDKETFTLFYGSSMPSRFSTQSLASVSGVPVISRSKWSGKRMVTNGDSITVGVNAGGVRNSFINLTAYELGMTLQNNGISGSTIAEQAANPTMRDPIINRYTDMDDDADLVIIAAGTNDCNYSWTPFGDFTDRNKNTFQGAVHLLCEGLIKKYPGKMILFLTPIKRAQDMPTPESTNAYGKTQKDYADAIKAICGYWGLPVLDMYSQCWLNPFVPEIASEYFDGVKTHPTASGHVVMSEILMTYLR